MKYGIFNKENAITLLKKQKNTGLFEKISKKKVKIKTNLLKLKIKFLI